MSNRTIDLKKYYKNNRMNFVDPDARGELKSPSMKELKEKKLTGLPWEEGFHDASS